MESTEKMRSYNLKRITWPLTIPFWESFTILCVVLATVKHYQIYRAIRSNHGHLDRSFYLDVHGLNVALNFVTFVDWLIQLVMCVVGGVTGVTQLHDVVYIVCRGSSTILRLSATTHQRLTDIVVNDLRDPVDIIACERTSRLYVSDNWKCVWRVSSDGEDIKRWLSKSPSETFKPSTLSVTSTRLLVTTLKHQLIQFDSDGDELRRVQLPDDTVPYHAVESPTGTFIVSRYNAQLEPVSYTHLTLPTIYSV